MAKKKQHRRKKIYARRLFIPRDEEVSRDLIFQMMEEEVGMVEILSWTVDEEKGGSFVLGGMRFRRTTVWVKYRR